MIAFALFKLNALGVGVFRLHALFFALDEIVDGLGRLFLLGRRFGRRKAFPLPFRIEKEFDPMRAAGKSLRDQKILAGLFRRG